MTSLSVPGTNRGNISQVAMRYLAGELLVFPICLILVAISPVHTLFFIYLVPILIVPVVLLLSVLVTDGRAAT
jgi:hypothetical protein